MKQKLKNTQRGITLVALVITIIVLLILAMVSIKIAIDGGLTTKAKDAVNTHNVSNDKETIGSAYSTYQIAKIQNKDYTMQEALDEQKANATATDIENGWLITFEGKEDSPYTLKKDGTIIEGEEQVELLEDSLAKAYADGKLKLGDEVAYTPASGHSYTSEKWGTSYDEIGHDIDQTLSTDDYETSSGSKSTKWKVIGVNTKTGTVNLISAEPLKVKKSSGNSDTYRMYGKEGYNNGVNELNKMCSVFGYGNGATGARSANTDDIDKALNYNKKNFTFNEYDDLNNIQLNIKYGYTTTYYGKRTTWTPKNTFEFTDTSKLDENGDYQRDGCQDGIFIDINGNVATDDNPITITSNVYMYTKDQFTDKIESNTLNTIFGDNEQFNFWLASRSVEGTYDSAIWSLSDIDDDTLSGNVLYISYGNDEGGYHYHYVRPVVSLKSNIQGEKDSSGIWQLK